MRPQEHVEEALETRTPFTAVEAGAWPPQHAGQLAKVALRCAEERKRRRPYLTAVLPELEALCEAALAIQVRSIRPDLTLGFLRGMFGLAGVMLGPAIRWDATSCCKTAAE